MVAPKKTVADLTGEESREEAFTALVDEQAGRLYALGMRFCGNRHEAEDMVQETFLQAYRAWDQFEGRSKASTWLYAIATRVCQRFHRKRVGEPERVESLEDLLPFGAPEIGVVPDEEGPLSEQIRAEGRKRIEAAIAGLSLEFRMPLVLKEIVGFTLAEIGQVMDLKEATVKTRLHRARLKIRKALEGGLPVKEVPFPVYSKQICLDLLNAKQDALDRHTEFTFPDQIVCDRCSELFATMDLASEICSDLGRGKLPDGLSEQLRARLSAEESAG